MTRASGLSLDAIAGLAGLITGAAPAHIEGRASIIVARWGPHNVVGMPPCPEDHLCMNVIGDVRLRDVITVAGPLAPGNLTARLEYHAGIIPEARLIALVRRSERGRPWNAAWLTAARPGDDACVPDWAFNGLDRPRGSFRRGRSICFRI